MRLNIQIERLHLRRIISEFREINNAVKNDKEQLQQWFWWARVHKLRLFKFLFMDTVFQKIAHFTQCFSCNYKFIIRVDDKFAGLVGINRLADNAPHPELWMFVTTEYQGTSVAPNVMQQIENYVWTEKHVNKIYTRTAKANIRAEKLLQSQGYHKQDVAYDLLPYSFRDNMIHWAKEIDNKKH